MGYIHTFGDKPDALLVACDRSPARQSAVVAESNREEIIAYAKPAVLESYKQRPPAERRGGKKPMAAPA